jgi:hypothetical protein
MNLQENIRRILKEDRFKGYKRFLKDNIFTDFPDYIINDMFRESGDLDYSQVQGMTKDQMIDYFFNGEGKRYFDRWGGYEGKNAKVVKIEWNDLIEPLQKFLKNKMSGENPNFPDSKEKLIKIMEREPNLGKGDNEPILLKYNKEGKIEDISGGNHRTYAAFELNDFKPILMKAYVDDHQKTLKESIRRMLKEESQKQSRLLLSIKQDGLYQVMKDTSLSLPQIISKTGELSREVLERYIKDFVENEAESIAGSDGDIGFVFPIPLSKNKEVESFYLSKGKLTLEINEYDSNGRVVMGSHERLINLSDSEINRIVKELIDWGEDTYYEL